MATDPSPVLDVLTLSDVAWEILDPEGRFDAEERAWVAALDDGGPPIVARAELGVRLDALAGGLDPAPPAVPPAVVAAVMAFLADHPERRADDASVVEAAVRARWSDGPPAAVARWLSAHARRTDGHRRVHGAPRPPRRSAARPAPPDGPLA